jgi:ABC-type multidrug transport system fused ATPase/permease subunit
MNANEISPKANTRLDRIKKVSGIFKAVFFVLTLAMAFITLWTAVVIAESVVECFRFGWANYYAEILHAGLAAGTDLIIAAFAWFCYKLFDLYSQGDLFTAEAVRCIRGIGILFFVIALAEFLCRWILPHPASSPHWVEFVNSILNVAAGLFSSFLILFIAWIMDEGRKIQEEQELTV